MVKESEFSTKIITWVIKFLQVEMQTRGKGTLFSAQWRHPTTNQLIEPEVFVPGFQVLHNVDLQM